MNLSPRDRKAIVVGGAGIAALLLINLLLLPWIDHWLAARSRIAESHAQLSDLGRQLKALVYLQDRLESTYAGGGGQALIASDAAQVRGPEIIRKALGQGGLAVQNIKSLPITSVRDIPNAVLVPFEAQGACRVEQLTQCLSQMSTAETILIVDQINVTNMAQDPGNLSVNITLSMLAEEKTTQ